RSSPRPAPVPAPPWSPGATGRRGQAARPPRPGPSRQLIGQPLIDQRGRPGWWPSDLRGTIAVSDIKCPSASRLPAAHRQAPSFAQPAGDAAAHGMNNTLMYVISAILVLMVVCQIREQQFHLRTLAGGGTP